MTRPPVGSCRTRSALRCVLAAVCWAALAATLVVAWPTRFGGRTGYTIVVGHSMDPTFASGDLVVTSARPAYATGDVIVYTIPAGEPGAGFKVVHRIVGGDAHAGFRTQGDNNQMVDMWRPRPDDIDGAVIARLPGAGAALRVAAGPVGLAALGAVCIAWLLWPPRTHQDGPDETAAGSTGRTSAGPGRGAVVTGTGAAAGCGPA